MKQKKRKKLVIVNFLLLHEIKNFSFFHFMDQFLKYKKKCLVVKNPKI